ncbi:MAG: DegT/DnrJ/EryC1/StrS family aminotransferase [bacterium]
MIPVFRPSYGEEEMKALTEVVKSGWIGQGPKTREFEEKFADFLGGGVRCIAVDSCSAALTLAVRMLCPPGGEVITTPMTFVSTNHAILRNGSSPVFCDIAPDTLNIDAGKIEPLISERRQAPSWLFTTVATRATWAG